MYIIDVIPLLRLPRHLPQTFTYFSSQKLEAGVLVMIKIRSKETPAVVIRSEEAMNRRIEIKRTDFELKPINKIVSPNPILTEKQIALGLWLAKYYIEPLSLIFKTIAPDMLKKSENEIPFPKPTDTANLDKAKIKPLLIRSAKTAGSIDFLTAEINEMINQNRQILILAPETSMARKILDSINNKFPADTIIDLSKKPAKGKFWEYYKKIARNETKIIVGVRSAALLPFSNLGLIVIAQENDDSHKQWEGHPLYDTRDIAEKLSELFGAKLALESNFPSIASLYRTKNGDYGFLPLPDRYGDPPSIGVVNMRLEQKKGNYSVFSGKLLESLKALAREKKRAILFVNRKGAANFIVCKNCGNIAECPLCKIPLIYYPEIRSKSGAINYERLICNHCNFNSPPQNLCPNCHGAEVKYLGLGTQKIEKQLKNELPYVNILRLDSDIAKNKIDEEKILASFEEKTPAILVATQQIFGAARIPPVALIGVVSLDAMLAIPDFKTNERVFKNVSDLAAISENILIQTYNPESPTLKTLPKLDYNAFYEGEIEERQALFYPPFSKIIKLNYRNLKPEIAKREASSLAYLIKENLKGEKYDKKVKILGPAPRFIFQEKGFYNWHIIIKTKADDAEIFDQVKRQIEKLVPLNWEIDVNPENLL